MEKISVVIQAGGESSRMGEDKGLLEFHNSTMVEYILGQVNGIGEETIIISNTPREYEKFGHKVYSDILPGNGALGGILTALHYASHAKCLLLACDMPFVNIDLLKYMISLSQGSDIVVPRLKDNGFIEPFRAIYSKSCIEPIKDALKNGNKKVISFYEQVNVRYVEFNEINKYDPDLLTFLNINTPNEFQKALKILKEEIKHQ